MHDNTIVSLVLNYLSINYPNWACSDSATVDCSFGLSPAIFWFLDKGLSLWLDWQCDLLYFRKRARRAAALTGRVSARASRWRACRPSDPNPPRLRQGRRRHPRLPRRPLTGPSKTLSVSLQPPIKPLPLMLICLGSTWVQNLVLFVTLITILTTRKNMVLMRWAENWQIYRAAAVCQ